MTSVSAGHAADLVVVGAGVLGLAHALDARSRGLSVTVIERGNRPVGASVRNFGHCAITVQAGDALRYACAGRAVWQRAAKEADFVLGEAGTVVVARAEDEYAVLEELAAERNDDVVHWSRVIITPP